MWDCRPCTHNPASVCLPDCLRSPCSSRASCCARRSGANIVSLSLDFRPLIHNPASVCLPDCLGSPCICGTACCAGKSGANHVSLSLDFRPLMHTPASWCLPGCLRSPCSSRASCCAGRCRSACLGFACLWAWAACWACLNFTFSRFQFQFRKEKFREKKQKGDILLFGREVMTKTWPAAISLVVLLMSVVTPVW